MEGPLKVLIIEDDPMPGKTLADILGQQDYEPLLVYTGKEGMARMESVQGPVAVALVDLRLPDLDGVSVLQAIKRASPFTEVIILTGYASLDTAVASLKERAFDYLQKPVAPGELLKVVERAIDRSARRQAEEALRQSEARFRSFIENALDVVTILETDGTVRYQSPSIERVLGYRPEEMIGQSAFAYVHPDDVENVIHAFTHVVHNSGTVQSIEFRFRHRDGSWHFLESVGKALCEGSEVGRVLVNSRDTTERRRMEEALQEEAEILAALARVGPEMISSLNTPVILERRCCLTAEVLGCDCSYTVLWQPEEKAYVVTAGYSDPPEQWEAIRALKVPHEAVAGLVARLEQEEVLELEVEDQQESLIKALLWQFGITAALDMALQRGKELIGVQVAGYRGRRGLSPRQKRIARGISQIASLALANARLLEELEQANRLKEDFAGTMSHEIRTPLNVIMGYNELLLDGAFGPLTPEQRHTLERVDINSRELLDLINAILDLSRLQSKRVPLELREVCVADLLSELEAEARRLNPKPALTLGWKIEPNLLSLHTDPVKLKMVLKNLLSNALKFTDQGSVTVGAYAKGEGVEFFVADTGIGIASENLSLIFEPFRQVGSFSTRRHGGVGLGLCIVRQLLELLGGTISVESKLGQGSIFRVWIPTSKNSGGS